MPDDLSGFEEEFQERLDEFFGKEEMSPGNKAIDEILNYFDVLDLEKAPPQGLDDCLHCDGDGIVYLIDESRNEVAGGPATFYPTQVCFCVPEHDLSWFGKRVHRDNRWEVQVKFKCKE